MKIINGYKRYIAGVALGLLGIVDIIGALTYAVDGQVDGALLNQGLLKITGCLGVFGFAHASDKAKKE